MRMQVGTELSDGRYVLRDRLKRTGMAEVWLAEQRGMHGFSKTVIVKMIHPDLNEQHEARSRFFDEAQFASKIRHPNVVEIYDFGEQDGIFYLVMEYIQGHDLEALIEQCKKKHSSIPIALICRLMADALKGLQIIHSVRDDRGQLLELVHRDISPQNLVVASSGVIKIIDFGVVKAREKSSRTRTGVIVGKLQYMSPEQLSSEELDARSDVFSLGLVMYELLTLEPRFRGSNLLEIFYEALNEPMPDVVAKRKDCPSDIVECVKRSLAQKKADRFQNAQEMQRALEAHLIQQGIAVTESDLAGYLARIFGQAGAGSSHSDAYTGNTTMVTPPAARGASTPASAQMGRAPSHTISAQPPDSSDENDPEMQRIRQALGPAANASLGGSGHTFDSRSASASHTFDSRAMGQMGATGAPAQRSPAASPSPQPPASSPYGMGYATAPSPSFAPSSLHPPSPSYPPSPPYTPPASTHPSSSFGGGSPFAQMEPSYRPSLGGSGGAPMATSEATVVLDTEGIGQTHEATVVLAVGGAEALQPQQGIPASALTSFGAEPTADLSRSRPPIQNFTDRRSSSAPSQRPYQEPEQEHVATQRTVIAAYPQRPKNRLWLWIMLGGLIFGVGLLIVFLVLQ